MHSVYCATLEVTKVAVDWSDEMLSSNTTRLMGVNDIGSCNSFLINV